MPSRPGKGPRAPGAEWEREARDVESPAGSSGQRSDMTWLRCSEKQPRVPCRNQVWGSRAASGRHSPSERRRGARTGRAALEVGSRAGTPDAF